MDEWENGEMGKWINGHRDKLFPSNDLARRFRSGSQGG